MRLYTLGYNVIDLKDVTVEFHDGNGKQAELIFDEGDFQWNEAQERIYVKNRGLIGQANSGTVKNGDDTPIEITISGRFSYYNSTSDGDYNTIGAVKGYVGNKSSPSETFVSVDSDACAPYACDIQLHNAPACGGAGNQSLKFPDFRWETMQFSVKNGTINITGKCNATEPEDITA